MKYSMAVRCIATFLLAVAIILPVTAQSGRKPRTTQSPTSSSTQNGQNGKSSAQNPQSPERDSDRDDEKKSSRPLADNTPTVVTDDGTIKLETALVTIPVSVTDREGRFYPDLKKRDFRIYEDNIEQEIESFESIEAPFHVVLLLDTSASTRFRLEDIQAAAVEFIRQLRRDDRVMVVSFDSSVVIRCDFTSDRDVMRQAIYATRTGSSTKLYEAVELSLVDALGPIKGRKAIVLFTDGVDTTSRRSTARGTIELVEESDVLIFPIRYNTEMDSPQSGGVILGNPGGLPFPVPGIPRQPNPRPPGGTTPRGPFPFAQFINFQFPGQWPGGQWPGGRVPTPGGAGGDYRRGEIYLQDLADRSGGRMYLADTLQNLSDAFARIADELRHQYALSYYPTNSTRDGSYRRIRVNVKQQKAIVRARDGYRAVPETQATNRGTNGSNDGRKKPEFKRKQVAGTK